MIAWIAGIMITGTVMGSIYLQWQSIILNGYLIQRRVESELSVGHAMNLLSDDLAVARDVTWKNQQLIIQADGRAMCVISVRNHRLARVVNGVTSYIVRSGVDNFFVSFPRYRVAIVTITGSFGAMSRGMLMINRGGVAL